MIYLAHYGEINLFCSGICRNWFCDRAIPRQSVQDSCQLPWECAYDMILSVYSCHIDSQEQSKVVALLDLSAKCVCCSVTGINKTKQKSYFCFLEKQRLMNHHSTYKLLVVVSNPSEE